MEAIRLLSDEIWRQLDPYAGRLSRRDVRRAAAAGVIVVLLLVAGYAVATSGLATPRLAFGNHWSYGDGRETGSLHHGFTVVNEGWFPVEIVGVGRDGPGLEQVAYPSEIGGHPTEAETAGRIEPGEALYLGVAYRVTDCEAVPDEPWPVPVRIARPWGTHTVWIELPTQSHDEFQLPPDQRQGDAVSWNDNVEWQRNLADATCYYAAGGEPWDFDRLED